MSKQQAFLGSPEHPNTAAFVCYITIMGWLIAYFWLYGYHPGNRLVQIHLRQSLFLHLVTFIINALLYFLAVSFVVYIIVVAALFALWFIGAMHAINGREKMIPLIGVISQSMFAFVK